MSKQQYLCNDCQSKFYPGTNEFICPCCGGVSFSPIGTNGQPEYPATAQMNIPEAQPSNRRDERKDHIIYYNAYGFKVMHTDSHFYAHTEGNISELIKPGSGVRFYTKTGATNAIGKMKEAKPDWDLKMKKIL